ncbi:MAG TPA: hypothetical protein VKP69_05995 [Isosphaeraceae bacterium]|nr:hypothetical protein [Isosphaeraceae bacterium]
MGEVGSVEDPLVDWDPSRRAALERLWATFAAATGGKKSLSDELIAERRVEAEAEEATPSSPRSFSMHRRC